MAENSSETKSKFVEEGKMAFVVGGTGEIGKELVKLLLTQKVFSKVVLIGRRKLTYEDELYKDVEQRVIDFDNIDNHAEDFKGFEAGYICLGTTRGKAGADGFVKIEHDYVVNSARLALAGGCKQMHHVTAVGSNKNSMFLYPRTKGQVEQELTDMKFDNLFIYRPGFLLCDREENRTGEKIVLTLIKPVTSLCPTSISVPTVTVAQAMVNRTLSAEPGGCKVEILENKVIHQASKV